MKLIVDASVAIKWFVEEHGTELADRLIDVEAALVAPDTILAEIGNALWKRYHRRELSARHASEAIRRAPGLFSSLSPTPALALEALRIATTVDHPIYDCFYLALAEREAAPLVTADRRLLSLSGRLPHLDIRPLAA